MPNALPHHRLGLRVFLILAGLYLLTFHGQSISRDEQIMLAAGRSLLFGSMHFPPVYGQTSSEYGIGLPVAALPFSFLDKTLMLAGDTPAHWPRFAHLTNALLMALLGLAFFRFCLRLGYAHEDSALAALLLGLTTQIFPYAGTFFSEPLTTLLMFLGFMALWIGVEESRPVLFASAGLALGAAILTRFAAIIYLPLFLIYAWGAAPSYHSRRPLPPRHLARRWVAICIPIVAAVLIQLSINELLRDHPLDFGYAGSDFTTGYFTGVWGLLFSPGRGLFLYNPVILFALISAPVFVRRHASAGAFALLFALITLLFHARFWTWHGGWTPGTRFLLPALPFLFLFLPEALNRWELRSAAHRIGLVGLALAGLVIQAAHILVNPLDANNELFGLLGRQENPFLFVPQYSSLAGVWTLMADGAWRWRAWSGLGVWPWIVPLAGAVLAAVFGLRVMPALARQWVWPAALDAWHALRTSAALAAILTLAVLLMVARIGKGDRGMTVYARSGDPMMGYMEFDPGGGEFARWTIPPMGQGVFGPAPQTIEWNGLLQAPLSGTYRFFAKARGAYELRLGDEVLFANADGAMPQHLQSAEIALERGQFYPFHGRFVSPETQHGVFYVYWTLPGEGVALAPIHREYLFPAPPGRATMIFTALWRKLWLVVLLIALPILIFAAHPTPLWRRRRGQ